jgi:Ca-activated chloride channel homolog
VAGERGWPPWHPAGICGRVARPITAWLGADMVLALVRFARILLAFSCLVIGVGCDQQPSTHFTIYSGSENEALEPIVKEFAESQNVAVAMVYMGSVEIANALHDGKAIEADAVWPASRLWLSLGDTQKIVRDDVSIMREPVIFGVKRSVADRLGWTRNSKVELADILAAAQAGKFRYAATSATQSNSGASLYFAALQSLSGHPDQALQAADLDSPDTRARLKALFATVNRSSASSGWLAKYLVEHSDELDGMVNYEGLIWETNQALIKAGKEPLCAVYPIGAIGIADHPLGYIAKDDEAKAKFFAALQKHLLSEPIQKRISAMGRRTGAIGMQGDASVLTPDQCFDVTRVISPIPQPTAEVIAKALALYQTALRKPSITAYVLDFSGSMGEAPRPTRADRLKEGIANVLEADKAAANLLQASPDDIHIVITFSDRVLNHWSVRGDDPAKLQALYEKIERSQPGGGTDIYSPVAQAMREIVSVTGDNFDRYFPAIILMTDGESNTGPGLPIVQREVVDLGPRRHIPVYSIGIGEADWHQLGELSAATNGKTIDSEKGLVKAFREAKGYN